MIKRGNLLSFSGIFILSTFLYPANISAQSVTMITDQTNHFLQTLSKEETQIACYQFDDTLRLKWTNLPVGLVPRPGIQYGSLSDSSRIEFHNLMSSLLSSQGYLKIASIMQLDDVLNTLIQSAFDSGKINQRVLERLQNLKWGHSNFYISVWGKPNNKTPWGLSFGGHHIAINLTVSAGSISMTPLFLGSDPAQIKSGKYAGWRVLSKEEDYGFMLINSLTEDQKKQAIINQEVPRDIITNPKSSQRISEYSGIQANKFDKNQMAFLKLLIREYTHNLQHDIAHDLYENIILSGLGNVYFAWIGSLQKDSPHYYVINGPDFLIEYDNYPNKGNHIHIILREKEGDFGNDILKEHYLKSEHHKN